MLENNLNRVISKPYKSFRRIYKKNELNRMTCELGTFKKTVSNSKTHHPYPDNFQPNWAGPVAHKPSPHPQPSTHIPPPNPSSTSTHPTRDPRKTTAKQCVPTANNTPITVDSDRATFACFATNICITPS